ncbi:MAG: hypothetical protein KKC51_09235 [Verrucomicrobia bacterium]|nr:hypothetical protein [Verrucomicrobiota bacterium]
MMKNRKKKGGFIISAELIMIATILVIGLLIGMVTLRNQVLAELKDLAEAFGTLDQSYAFTGTLQVTADGETAQTSGSEFEDAVDSINGDLIPHTVLIPPGDYPGGEAETIDIPTGP